MDFWILTIVPTWMLVHPRVPQATLPLFKSTTARRFSMQYLLGPTESQWLRTRTDSAHGTYQCALYLCNCSGCPIYTLFSSFFLAIC